MINSSRTLALALLAGLGLATPMAAYAASDTHDNRPTPLSAPSPVQQLDHAAAEIRSGQVKRADSDLMLLQDRLLSDSIASDMPANVDISAMRNAVTPLDTARAALRHGDTTAALSAITTARDML